MNGSKALGNGNNSFTPLPFIQFHYERDLWKKGRIQKLM